MQYSHRSKYYTFLLKGPICINDNMHSNKSPLRYPGGKTRACKSITELLESHYDISQYQIIASPFFGGGSFEFHMQNNHGLKIIGNDKFKPLYSFWNECKYNKEKLVDELNNVHHSGVTKECFNSMRSSIMEETDSLSQSVQYFVINRCSFSGATLSGGFSEESSKKRFTKSSIERVKDLELNDFDMHNQDFELFIELVHGPSVFLFLDPPYYLESKSKLYGKNGDMHEDFDHRRLYECIVHKTGWMMTYNDCAYIRELYRDFEIVESQWSYGMNKSKQSSEIVIFG